MNLRKDHYRSRCFGGGGSPNTPLSLSAEGGQVGGGARSRRRPAGAGARGSVGRSVGELGLPVLCRPPPDPLRRALRAPSSVLPSSRPRPRRSAPAGRRENLSLGPGLASRPVAGATRSPVSARLPGPGPPSRNQTKPKRGRGGPRFETNRAALRAPPGTQPASLLRRVAGGSMSPPPRHPCRRDGAPGGCFCAALPCQKKNQPTFVSEPLGRPQRPARASDRERDKQKTKNL